MLNSRQHLSNTEFSLFLVKKSKRPQINFEAFLKTMRSVYPPCLTLVSAVIEYTVFSDSFGKPAGPGQGLAAADDIAPASEFIIKGI